MARQIGNVAAGAAAARRRRPQGPLAAAANSGGPTPGEQRLLREAYHKYGVLPRHLAGLIDVESDWDRWATSPAGAKWLTQFMPGTAASYGVHGSGKGALRSQIFGAAHYLDDLGYEKGNRSAIELAFAKYNAGPANPGGAGSYPQDVLAASRQYKGIGRGAAGPGGGSGGGGSPATPGSVTREQVQPGGTGIVELVRALEERNQAPAPSTPLQAPAFSAGPTLPQGYAVPETGPPAPPPPDLADLMSLVQPGAPVPRSTYTPGTGPDIGGGGGGGRITGLPNYGPSGGRNVNVVGAPLDRPGAKTHPYVVHAVDLIADILGSPIELGTGTQHNQFTTNGNISAHWSGNAVDLPSTGKRLMAIGRSALIAAGMNPHEARKAGPGLYNINGWQIIFGTNSPALGGDHTDHVHVQPPAGWKRPRRWR